MQPKRPGYYFGTAIDGKWYRRYGQGMYSRGSGEYWFEKDGLYFSRYLTAKPLFIPYSEMTDVQIGKWHCGKWGMGYKVIKIYWGKATELSSGFILSKDNEAAVGIAEEIKSRCNSV